MYGGKVNVRNKAQWFNVTISPQDNVGNIFSMLISAPTLSNLFNEPAFAVAGLPPRDSTDGIMGSTMDESRPG
jgi:hypothetical protein